MPKKLEVDNKKLVEMVKNGATTKEMMVSFGFKTPAQAKMAYLNAAMEEGIVPGIKDGRASSKSESKSNEISVSKRGSLVVPKEVVADMGFKEGDSFEIRKTKAGLSLKQTHTAPAAEHPKPVIKTRKKQAA